MKAHEVCAWLNGLGEHIKDAKPVAVTIAGKTYFGARYTAVSKYTEGMRIVQEGKVKAGDIYTDDRFYLLGQHPHKLKGKVNYCFPYNGSEWYVGGYYEGSTPNEHHPFGRYFGVHEWKVPDGTKIDTYEPYTYAREPMTVVEVE